MPSPKVGPSRPSGGLKRRSPAKSTTSRSGAEGEDGGGAKKQKRMASLSSFQATLNFSAAPKPPTGAGSGRPAVRGGGSNGAGAGLGREWGRTKSADARAMPPPSSTAWKSSKATASSSGHRSMVGGEVQGKGKEREVVEILDEDGEDDVDVDMDAGRRTPVISTMTTGARYDMWTERYAPSSKEELAPGKARIAKLRGWLHEALYGCSQEHAGSSISVAARDRIRKYKRILLVTGPAGIGKTTTIKVLADEMGVELIEWNESVEEWSLGSSGFDRESGISKLQAFLSRHGYAPLHMSTTSTAFTSPAKRPSSSPNDSSMSQPRLLLLTALPNIGHTPTKEAFHAALRDFCKTYTSSSCPLVIVHSDAGSGGRAEESWMDRERGGREGTLELLGREVKEGPWVQEIEFIGLAPTFLTKALKRVLHLAEADGAVGLPPGAVQLVAISANGDLRSAINSLQMLCASAGGAGKDGKKAALQIAAGKGSKKKASGKGSRGGKGAKLDVSNELRAILDAVSRREQSLGLFHALGKVFYNKRLGDPGEDDEDAEMIAAIRSLPIDEPLPDHLRSFERRKSLVQMEPFIPTIPVDASSFALWLHQSLPSFCSQVDEASEALDYLCAADIMRTDEDIWQSSQQAISYALNLTVRGAQISLPSPVPRKHQRILKPDFFERYRAERDNLVLLDTAAGYLAKKAVSVSVALAEYDLNNAAAGGNPWGGALPKSVLASEVIPMMVKLQGLTRNPLLPLTVSALRLPPYVAAGEGYQEALEAGSRDIDQGVEEDMAGEDGMGEVPLGEGWDQEGDAPEEKEFLEDDDIQAWD